MRFKKGDYIVRHEDIFVEQKVFDVGDNYYRLFDLETSLINYYDSEYVDQLYELDIKKIRKYKLKRIDGS